MTLPSSYASSPVHRSPLPPGPSFHPSSTASLGFEHLDARSASSVAAYATPRLSNANVLAGTAPGTSAKEALARSLSLGRASYAAQQHPDQQQQQQQHLHQLASPGRPAASGSASPSLLQSPYSPSSHSHAQQHAAPESSRSAANRNSLLPTINTAFSRTPLSPLAADASAMVQAHSPRYSLAPASPYGSSYLPTAATSHQRADQSGANSGTFAGSSGMDYASGSRRTSRNPSPNMVGGFSSQLDVNSSAANEAAHHDSLPYAYNSSAAGSQQNWSSTGHQQGGNNLPTAARPYSQRWEGTSQGQGGAGLSRSVSTRIKSEDRSLARAPPPPREQGLRRVRDLNDLRPKLDPTAAATTRRADPSGGYVSPLKAMTSYLHHTYHLVNPSFIYELSFNPRRVLTKPSKPMYNNGHDNEDSDYILYVNDWLGNEEGNRYLILDILGQGTFGQVVKCQNMRTHEIVAVKVIKNKPAYYKQSMMEVTILEMLNANWDPDDKHHILRLRDTFIHAEHLCLVFELLSSNLYELIKQNSFRGLSTSLVRVFTAQLLDALTVLNEANLIHCDLKPENILLRTLQTPSIKLVDFGSACHEKQTVYTYIQSRFYRSPEVLLGLPYNSAIDLWSLGCIAVELFLGLPLFPGTSEYNQVFRIVEMLGLPPQYMLEQGKQTADFFNVYTDEYGRKSFRLKSFEQYVKEHNATNEVPSKKYFSATTLPDIIKTYPLSRKSGKPADAQKEMANRASFVDFVSGLLNMDPHERWTPQQAKLHPFITGEKFSKPFKPPRFSPEIRTQNASAARVDPNKHQFGGLLQTSNRSSGRAYHDAAAYNQHLAQQQAYHTAHKARQAQPLLNNPYAQDRDEVAAQASKAQQQAQAQLQAQQAAQAHAAMSGYGGPLPTLGPASGSGTTGSTGGGRSRSNTQSMQMSSAGKAALGVGLGNHTSLSPGREDWDQRQNGSGAAATGQQQQQRAQRSQFDLLQHGPGESAPSGSNWQSNWGLSPQTGSGASPYTSPQQGSVPTPSRQYHSPGGGGFSVVVEGHDRQSLPNPHDVTASSSHAARASPMAGAGALSPQSHAQSSASAAAAKAGIAAPPPAAYATGASSSSRYLPNLSSGLGAGVSAAGMSAGSSAAGMYSTANANKAPTIPFDAFDSAQPSIAQLMPALKPQQYHGGGGGSSAASGSGVLPPQQHQPQQRQSMILPTSSAGGGYHGGGGAGTGGPHPPPPSMLPGLGNPSSSGAGAGGGAASDDPFALPRQVDRRYSQHPDMSRF